MSDRLFFSDALGSGMDNIPRYPPGWQDDGEGIRVRDLHPEIFTYRGLGALWNRQGRSVDMSAQMALFAEDLQRIARQIGEDKDVPVWQRFYDETKQAINERCWHEEDGFYYDLGYGKHIRRQHIGMFWTLVAGIASDRQAGAMMSHLANPRKFWRVTPVATFAADQPGFSPTGNYWLGGVWAPTNYMVILGLLRYRNFDLARKLAQQYYFTVAQVFRERRTFFENYAPDQVAPGVPAKGDFCGWTAIAPITLYREFLSPS
jgi:neutral trehalase